MLIEELILKNPKIQEISTSSSESLLTNSDKSQGTCQIDTGSLNEISYWADLISIYKEINENNSQLNKPNINFSKISNDLLWKKWDIKFNEEKKLLPNKVAYKIWEAMFLTPEPYRNEQDLSNLNSNDKTKLIERKFNGKNYLQSMTDLIISLYRDKLCINDRFIWKCFEHELDNTLSFIEDNKEFFNIKISSPHLIDLYILLSIDADNIKWFLKYVSHLNKTHFEYALQYGSFEFLMMIWKSKNWIPQFDNIIKELDSTMMYKKNWKQCHFFDWCKNH